MLPGHRTTLTLTLEQEFFLARRPSSYTVPFYWNVTDTPTGTHGIKVASVAIGNRLGVAPKASWIPVSMPGLFDRLLPVEALIEGLLWIADDVKHRKREGRAVINLSLGINKAKIDGIEPYKDVLGELMLSCLGETACLLLTGP